MRVKFIDIYSKTVQLGSNNDQCYIQNRVIKIQVYNKVYINHDPLMTLTQFIAMSTWVVHAFGWGKLLKCHLKGKKQQEIGK